MVVACVLKVRVAVTGPPEIGGGWVAVQVGASTAPDAVGPTTHVSATLPVNPPPGVTVTVEVAEAP